MILSNVEIYKALDERRIKIDPEPRPRLHAPGQDSPFDTHTVDLTLGPSISIPNGGSYNFDIHKPSQRKGEFAKFMASNSTKHTITEDRPYLLAPTKFILAQTVESLCLPIRTEANRILGTCIAARIEGKSSR